MFGSDYQSNFPWDVCLNSSKRGILCFCIFRRRRGQTFRKTVRNKMIPAKPQPVVRNISLDPARLQVHTTYKNNLFDQLFDPSETPSSCLEHFACFQRDSRYMCSKGETAHMSQVEWNTKLPTRPKSNGTRNSTHTSKGERNTKQHTRLKLNGTRNSTRVQSRTEHETARTPKSNGTRNSTHL